MYSTRVHQIQRGITDVTEQVKKVVMLISENEQTPRQ